jgi:hypothetical protein
MGIAFPPKPPKFPPATIAGSHVELVWAGCLARHNQALEIPAVATTLPRWKDPVIR